MKKEDLKIIFLGTPDFAVESLSRLVDDNYNVAAVVTMPDKPAGRGHKMLQSPIKQYALQHGLRLLQPENLKNPEFIAELKSIDADLFVVIAFRMLPEIVWQMPRLGTFNLHGSLLPNYRGAAPINWAIINGEKQTGVTTFFLKHEIDTGDILQQVAIDILPEDDFGTIYDKLMHIGADLTVDTIQHILAGDLQPMPQDQLAKGEITKGAPKIFKETCQIKWDKTAEEIHNLVRGLSPYPAAWTIIKAEGIEPFTAKILKSTVIPYSNDDLTPGKIIIDKGRMIVDTSKDRLEILSIQPQGKKQMSTADFIRGARLVSPSMA